MPSKLELLRNMGAVVADTGDLEAIRRLRPEDATTNPSLILKAVNNPAYAAFITEGRRFLSERGQKTVPANLADFLAVRIGKEILQVIPGLISTEVDARLSFDTAGTLDRAHALIELYESLGVERSRILIKIAATWEGIQAARQLEAEGIRCNLTLLFSFTQAVACADAGVTLISPFVGRIYDWYCRSQGVSHFEPAEDPGVQSVRRIYHWYKARGCPTIVMGASFRNTGQIEALAGCDKLTISPELLDALDHDSGPLLRCLSPTDAGTDEGPQDCAEPTFRWQMNEDAMATEKLAEGIRKFAEDQTKLEVQLARILEQS